MQSLAPSSALKVSRVRKFLDDLPPDSWVSLQGKTESTKEFARLASADGLKVVLNPSPVDQFLNGFPRRLVEVVVVNQLEAESLAVELAEAHTVIATGGDRGVMLRQRETVVHMESTTVQAVDTTGAGDAFSGVMAGYLANGTDIRNAIRAGVATCDISVALLDAETSESLGIDPSQLLKPHPPLGSIDEQYLEGPITVVVTGPLTNLHELQKRNSDAFANIERIYWMGGAFEVAGNLNEIALDGSAEWNAYWDSTAAEAILQAGVPMAIIPLDATRPGT